MQEKLFYWWAFDGPAVRLFCVLGKDLEDARARCIEANVIGESKDRGENIKRIISTNEPSMKEVHNGTFDLKVNLPTSRNPLFGL